MNASFCNILVAKLAFSARVLKIMLRVLMLRVLIVHFNGVPESVPQEIFTSIELIVHLQFEEMFTLKIQNFHIE